MKGSDKEKIKEEFTPFENIALSFSGGGFRAATFALGVLSFLNELTFFDAKQNKKVSLLQNVKFISSASGGSIATAMYAQHVAKNREFKEFYAKLFKNLYGNKLLNEALEILNDRKKWSSQKKGRREKNFQKKRNMINSFALAYDESLFKEKEPHDPTRKFDGILEDLTGNSAGSHLEEICLNATDLFRGITFRQNIKMRDDEHDEADRSFRYGNFYINLGLNTAKKLKLSDLLAASSCFPGGFEPIIFPNEFTYDTEDENPEKSLSVSEILEALKIPYDDEYSEYKETGLEKLYGKNFVKELKDKIEDKKEEPYEEFRDVKEINKHFQRGVFLDKTFKFALMDGGITDNQGLESILDAHKRREVKKENGKVNSDGSFMPFDLMLINDVGSHFMDSYKSEKITSFYSGWKALTINWILAISWSMVGFCVALILVMFLNKITTGWFLSLTLISIVGFTLGALILLILYYTREKVKKEMENLLGLDFHLNFYENVVEKLFEHFGSIQIGVILRMLQERVKSLLTLNNDVFLKRIRFLLYDKAFESQENKFRIKGNRIYDLTFSNDLYRFHFGHKDRSQSKKELEDESLERLPEVNPNLRRIAQTAFDMGTTLWFETKENTPDRRAALIASGQFTTCYNLLRYIYLMKRQIRDDKYVAVKQTDTWSIFDNLPEEYKNRVLLLEKRLREFFDCFSKDPFWLYNQLGCEIKGFERIEISSPDFDKKFPIPDEFKDLRYFD